MSESQKYFRPGSKRTKEFLLAKTMMVLVMVFLILNTPRIILGVIEVSELTTVERCYEHDLDYHVSKETYILDFLARFLVILNSSVNFVIYCLVGSEFRSNMFNRLNRRSGTRSKEVSSAQLRWRKEESQQGIVECPSCDGTVITRLNTGTTMELGVGCLNRSSFPSTATSFNSINVNNKEISANAQNGESAKQIVMVTDL